MARAENLMFFKKSPAILIDQIWQDYLKLPVVFNIICHTGDAGP